jgi:hypothetical protein
VYRSILQSAAEKGQALHVNEDANLAKAVQEELDAKLAKFQELVTLESDTIMYGEEVEPHARQKYLDEFGCARWYVFNSLFLAVLLRTALVLLFGGQIASSALGLPNHSTCLRRTLRIIALA